MSKEERKKYASLATDFARGKAIDVSELTYEDIDKIRQKF